MSNPLSIPLSKRAAKINELHNQAMMYASTTLEKFRSVGMLLIEAKKVIRRGHFGPWVAEYCHFSARTAQGYVRLATKWDQLSGRQQATLGLEGALDLLKERSADSKTQG